MANQKHEEMLRKGSQAWNGWREDYPGIKPDLVGAHLEKVQLQGANLEEAQLQGTNLFGAQLQGANLSGAQLQGAILSRTQLHGAVLFGTQLQGADLLGAQLQGADLRYARLQRADLREAQLQGATLREAAFDSATKLNRATLGDEKFGGISVVDVSWGGVNLAVVDWLSIKMLGEEQEAQEKKHDDKVKDRETRLEEHKVAVRANRQLAVALQTQGLNEDAARFAYHAQKLQRGVLWYQRKFGQYLFSLFLSLTSGYGYRLWRGFATYMFVIFGFATAYYLLGPVANLSLSPLDAIIFSMTSFHGRGFSPGENIGLSNPLTILAAIEAFVGLIIEVTLITTLTQRFFGK